jgi:hypothetical protein
VDLTPTQKSTMVMASSPRRLRLYVLCTRVIAICLLLAGLGGFVTEIDDYLTFSVWDGLFDLAGHGFWAYFVWTTGSIMRAMGLKNAMEMAG